MNDEHLKEFAGMVGKSWTGDKKPEDEDEDLGPCAARATPKGWTALIVKNARDGDKAEVGLRGFQFCHIGFTHYRPGGLSFVLEFNEPEKWRVVVKGRNLERIFTNLVQHKLEWIRRADRDFPGDDPIITELTIERVKED